MDMPLDTDILKIVNTLFKMNTTTCSAKSWHDAIEQIVPQLHSSINLDYIVVYLNNNSSNSLDVMYAWKNPGHDFPEELVFTAEELAHKVFFGEQSELLFDLTISENAAGAIKFLGQALTSANTTRNGAIVYVKSCSETFSDIEQKIASFVSQQISLLINIERGETGIQITKSTKEGAILADELLSLMAHEIATPLGFIKGYTTTLMRADTSWDPTLQLEFLQIIDQETEHLETMVHNILDSARLQSGRITMAFQPIRIDTILNDVMARYHVRFPDLKITTKVQPPVNPIPGDPLRISQVFDNIIGNAVKYAPHSPIWVKINQEEKYVHIEIADKGPGIPPQYLPYIFEKYYRNPELSPSVHGSGLGLFICKQIINAHYGQLYVESEVGHGSCFHILLPYS